MKRANELKPKATGPSRGSIKGEMRVKKVLSALAAISIWCGVGVAEQLPRSQDRNVENRRMFLDARAPDLPPRYSALEIRKMIHDAKTPDDFRRLADYFDFQAMEFEQRSEVQLKELQRLLALRFHARTYATQVDNTRELMSAIKLRRMSAQPAPVPIVHEAP